MGAFFSLWCGAPPIDPPDSRRSAIPIQHFTRANGGKTKAVNSLTRLSRSRGAVWRTLHLHHLKARLCLLAKKGGGEY